MERNAFVNIILKINYRKKYLLEKLEILYKFLKNKQRGYSI